MYTYFFDTPGILTLMLGRIRWISKETKIIPTDNTKSTIPGLRDNAITKSLRKGNKIIKHSAAT